MPLVTALRREVLMFLVWKLRFQVRMVIVAMRIVSHQPSLLLLMKPYLVVVEVALVPATVVVAAPPLPVEEKV
jgi:hypothetical protein